MAQDLLPPTRVGGIVGFELVATAPATAPLPTETFPIGTRIQDIQPVPGLADTYAVLDTRGVVWLLEGDTIRPEPLIDLRTPEAAGLDFVPTTGFGENGLRSIAFHPDFANPEAEGYGKVYLAYSAKATAAARGDTRVFDYDVSNPDPGFTAPAAPVFDDVVAEFDVDPATLVIDPASDRELMRIAQPYSNHNFGQLKFNPHAVPGDADYGLLYLTIGDGGAADDRLNVSQRLDQVLGKILLIDPLEGGSGEPYTVPADNPFVGVAGALPEIVAYGLRNPQQIDFTADGRILISEIGQNAAEEVNLYVPGGNYGWDITEGTFLLVQQGTAPTTAAPLGADDFGFQYPVAQYDHFETPNRLVAIGGGVAYEASELGFLLGSYVFPDVSSGEFFYVPLDGVEEDLADDGRIDPGETRAPQQLLLIDGNGQLTSFGALTGFAIPGLGDVRAELRFAPTTDGEILAFSKVTGNIYRLTASDLVDTGGAADDALAGERRKEDTISGVAGDDTLSGLSGDDLLLGGLGDDLLRGGIGNDTIDGGAGANLLRGGTGDDRVIAAAGDRAFGGAGTDMLVFLSTVAELSQLTEAQRAAFASLFDTGGVDLRKSALDFRADGFEAVELQIAGRATITTGDGFLALFA